MLRASCLNFERLYILPDSIGHACKKLLSFDIFKSFHFQFEASRYITGLNQTSVYKVIVISICSELLVSILSVSIYYPIQSDIRVKCYCRLNWLRVLTFNFERLVILRDSIRHPTKKLLSFDFAQNFNIQFRASQYITGLNQTSEKKVIVV